MKINTERAGKIKSTAKLSAYFYIDATNLR